MPPSEVEHSEVEHSEVEHSTVERSTVERSTVKDYYDRMRRLIEHEDTLELQRLQSLFAVQTILFGALAFALGGKGAANQLPFLTILATVGIVSAWSFGVALWLGRQAMKNLLGHWGRFVDRAFDGSNLGESAPLASSGKVAAAELPSSDEQCELLGMPPIIGYLHSNERPSRWLPSKFAPWTFGVLWVILPLVIYWLGGMSLLEPPK